MGILKRIKGRVSSGVGLVKDGIQAIQEESKRPEEPADSSEASEEPEVSTSSEMPEVERPVEDEAPGGGPFWFLDGENDGWDETNPGASENGE